MSYAKEILRKCCTIRAFRAKATRLFLAKMVCVRTLSLW
jgi:hypothetical protein